MTEEKNSEEKTPSPARETAPVTSGGAETTNPLEEAAEKIQNDFFADFDPEKVNDDPETLLKAGVHFGHRRARRHPRMKPFIFTVRDGVTIIDLRKTQEGLRAAGKFLAEVRRSGKPILFSTTKKQAVDLLRSAAERAGEPYVINRWLGGTFTNFAVIGKRVKYLVMTEEKMAKGSFRKYTKFEQLKKKEEIDKLNRKMGGLKKMRELPGALVVLDVKADALAVAEARKAGIPVVAITDTNVDPSLVDYPVPANDDAVSSLKLLLGLMLKYLEGVTPTEKKNSRESGKATGKGAKEKTKEK